MTCGALIKGVILLGDSDGSVSVTDRKSTFSEERKFKIFRGPVISLVQIWNAQNATSLVAALGCDNDSTLPSQKPSNSNYYVKVAFQFLTL